MRVIQTTGIVGEDGKMIIDLAGGFAPGVYDVVVIVGEKVADSAERESSAVEPAPEPEVEPVVETVAAVEQTAATRGTLQATNTGAIAGTPANALLVEMFKHNLWANLRLLDACEKLTDAQLGLTAEGAYGTIRNTLVHMLAAEGRYVSRLLSTPEPTFHERQGWPGIADLRLHAEASGQELINYAEQARGIRTLRGMWRGEPYEMPDSVPMVQAIQHANEHRTNITTLLAQHGLESPDVSMWAYDASMK